MTFEEPTYEEYKSATKFAKFRYKYGLIITALCWVALVLIIVFMLVYSKELSTHPIRYTMDKFDLKYCFCYGNNNLGYYINETAISWIEKIVEP